ncbi:MAG: protein kinase [Deltaproteobacteria bacterium]|nr:protein kinase [Deltaproteobacteria bacterium]
MSAEDKSGSGLLYLSTLAGDGLDEVRGRPPAPETDRDPLGPLTEEPAGRYRTRGEDDLVGSGGIGRVLRAVDTHLGREVAVKELRAERLGAGLDVAEQRFVEEARVTGGLEHPSIIPVHELGRRADGSLYYTMKLVRGRTLEQAIAEAAGLEGRLALLGHFLGLCQAVAYAHEKAVIHRDLKPANVMVGAFGETIVIDWGLARIGGHRRATEMGKPLGTPAYMSPEQALGQQDLVGKPADVWGLGAILYELLTGRPPFSGASAADVLAQVLQQPLRPVRAREPNAPRELVAICERALTRDIATRYPDAKALAAEVQAYLVGGKVSAYTYSSLELVRRFVARNKALTTALVTAVVATIIGGVLLLDAWRTADARRVEAEHNADVAAAQTVRADAAATEAARREREAHMALAGAFGERSARALADADPGAAAVFAAAGLAETGLSALDPVGSAMAALSTADRDRLVDLLGAYHDALRREGVVFERILGPSDYMLRELVVSADGRWAAMGRQGIGATTIWDLRTGVPVRDVDVETLVETRVAFLPGDRIAVVGLDGLRVERVAGGELSGAKVPAPPGGNVGAGVVASPDGGLLALQAQGELVIYAADDLSERLRLPAPTRGTRMAWSRDGRWLLMGDVSGAARLVDVAAGTVRPCGHGAQVVSVAISPDDGLAALAEGDDGLALVTLPGCEERRRWSDAARYAAAFDERGELLAVGGDRVLELIRLADDTTLQRFDAHAGRLRDIAWTPGPDTRLVSFGANETGAVVWRVDPGDQRLAGPSARPITDLAVAPDGLVALATAGELEVWRPGGDGAEPGFEGAPFVFNVAVGPGRVAAIDWNGAVRIWDAAGAEVFVEKTAETPGGLTWSWLRASRDGGGVWAYDSHTHALRRFRLTDGERLDTMAVAPTATAIEVAADDRTVVVGHRDGRLDAFRRGDSERFFTTHLGASPPVALRVAPNGRHLAWLRRDGEVGVLDLERPDAAVLWRHSGAPVAARGELVWASDSASFLASAAQVTRYEAATGSAVERLPGTRTVQRLPDGDLAVARGRWVYRVAPAEPALGAPAALVAAAEAAAGRDLDGGTLLPRARVLVPVDPASVGLESQSGPAERSILGLLRNPAGGPNVMRAATLRDPATRMVLVNASNGAPVASARIHDNAFRLEAPGATAPGDGDPPLALRFEGAGSRRWFLSPLIRPGRRLSVFLLFPYEISAAMATRSLGAELLPDRPVFFGRVQYGAFAEDGDSANLRCAVIRTEPPCRVVYATDQTTIRDAPTDASGSFGLLDMPVDVPIRVIAALGGREASVTIPALAARDVGIVIVPFLAADGADPTPAECP